MGEKESGSDEHKNGAASPATSPMRKFVAKMTRRMSKTTGDETGVTEFFGDKRRRSILTIRKIFTFASPTSKDESEDGFGDLTTRNRRSRALSLLRNAKSSLESSSSSMLTQVEEIAPTFFAWTNEIARRAMDLDEASLEEAKEEIEQQKA